MLGPQEVEEQPDPELSAVQLWRVEELTRVGMEEWQAECLALDGPLGWSKARDLIEGGCPPYLAFDIVR